MTFGETLVQWGIGLVVLAAALVPVVAGLWTLYWLATLPWRRAERARVFLDVLAAGLRSGLSPEDTVREAGSTGDGSLPGRIRVLAAHLKRGLSLAQVLEMVPMFLPPEVHAMLVLGLRRGQLAAVLPVCRAEVSGRPSVEHGGLVSVGAFLILPGSTAALFFMISTVVFPKFRMIAQDLNGGDLPTVSDWVMEHGWQVALVLLALKLAVYVVAFSRVAGPKMDYIMPLDRLALILPWRRQRLHRRFAHLLAVELDLGVPEAEAVMEAAAGTANHLWLERADVVVKALRNGVALPDALDGFRQGPEFRWRLALGLRRSAGVGAALRGWIEGLEERAARNELMAAESFFTAVILSNALLVGLTAVAVIGYLSGTIENGTLW